MAIETVHFLVHPFYRGNVIQRPQDVEKNFERYKKKITALSNMPDAHFVIIEPKDHCQRVSYEKDASGNLSKRKVELDYVEELKKHARKEFKGRFTPFIGNVNERTLKQLRKRMSPDARFEFFGESLEKCIDQEQLRAAFALGVKPEEFARRTTINHIHSLYEGEEPVIDKLLRLRSHKRRMSAFRKEKTRRESQEAKSKEFYPLYYVLRRSGKSHDQLFKETKALREQF